MLYTCGMKTIKIRNNKRFKPVNVSDIHVWIISDRDQVNWDAVEYQQFNL